MLSARSWDSIIAEDPRLRAISRPPPNGEPGSKILEGGGRVRRESPRLYFWGGVGEGHYFISGLRLVCVAVTGAAVLVMLGYAIETEDSLKLGG
jgi:hypothetical protein